jgi:hypothetical protein
LGRVRKDLAATAGRWEALDAAMPCVRDCGRVIWKDGTVTSTRAIRDSRSFAELTRSYFGETLSMAEVFALVAHAEPSQAETVVALWVGSVGYECHKDHRAFAQHLSRAGIERVLDVRELPISRRRGYAKSALSRAMAEVGIEYVHLKALGNPKPFRDMYKSGRVEEGRRCFEAHLLTKRRDALRDLVPLLRDKRSALMCVEHDPTTCHRTVILDALREELGLELDVAQIA